MSYRDIHRAEEALRQDLIVVLPSASIEQIKSLVENIKDLAEAIADERLDREFNRGDWRS